MAIDSISIFVYSNYMSKKLIIFLIFIFSFLIFVRYAKASTLYLSPGSTNIPAGSVVSVSVGINTAGESVNGVSAYLSYPTDKLEVAWISYGSRFDLAAEGTYGGGSIRISRGSISGVVGNVNVATVGFKGKSLGTATVAFVGGSAAPRSSDSSDSLNLGGSSGGIYTVVAPLPITPTPTGGEVSKLLISNVKVNAISTNSATITWETNEKSDSTLEFGLFAKDYFISVSDKNLTLDHSIKVEGKALTPGTAFHFIVKSKDEAGNEAVSSNQTFQLKGYDVKVKILDLANNPVKDTDVYLYTEAQKLKTDSNGEAHFANVTLGKHLVVVKLKNNFDKTGEIDVLDSPSLQSFVLKVDAAKSKTYDEISILIGLLVVIVIITIIVAVLVIKKRRGGTTTSNIGEAPQVQQPLS